MTPLAKAAWAKLALSLSTAGLQALLRGLRTNDPALSQNPTKGLDAVSYALRHGDGIEDWDTLRASWQRHLSQCDGGGFVSGDPLSWHWFAWHDQQPRDVFLVTLLELVEIELARREMRGALTVSVC
jgi:hypothetical protein